MRLKTKQESPSQPHQNIFCINLYLNLSWNNVKMKKSKKKKSIFMI